MKKVNFKGVLKVLFVAFALLFVGVSESGAQTLSGSGNSIYAVPSGDFVSANEAITLIQGEFPGIKANGQGASQAVLSVLEDQWSYYESMLEKIESGVLVPKAIVESLQLMGSDVHQVEVAQLEAFKQMAVDLLSQ